MTATLTAQASDSTDRAGLSARLTALARLVHIGSARTGPDGFDEDLLAQATQVLTKAGQRLMLSSNHTVVALAGGTGSGKSALFNQLAGADFSPVGVTRPMTKEAHACVWGVTGSGPLLEWLGVPRRHRYARASELSSEEQSMRGLVLLDLPDHDSVLGHATGLVDKLVGLSDLIIWVLDPQKYADAAVHRRFLVPLAGHSEVVAVVLSQVDLLTAGQMEDCVQDLRRLLDSEHLHDVQILVTSAKTGEGIEELRKLLVDAVSARTSATSRISADVAKVVAEFEPYGASAIPAAAGYADAGNAPGSYAPGSYAPGGYANAGNGDGGRADGGRADGGHADGGHADGGHADGRDEVSDTQLPAGTQGELATSFADAAGVSAIGEALRSARELRAADYVGWPISWVVERLASRDPVRKIRLGKLWDELREVSAGPSGAHQAEIDNALTQVADHRVPPLRTPWSRTVRTALRSRAQEIPAALSGEISAELPADPAAVDSWWRSVGVLQGVLLGCVLVGVAWLVALLVCGVGHVGSGGPKLFTDVWLMPWAGLAVVVGLLGGWLTGRIFTKAISEASERETRELVESMRTRLGGVAYEYVVAPAEQELAELERFRAELRTASGRGPFR